MADIALAKKERMATLLKIGGNDGDESTVETVRCVEICDGFC